MNSEIVEHLRARLRAPATPRTVPGSLPVLFFGDLYSASIATVGLNPSNQEYTDKRGVLLSGARQRFATLDSLGAADRSALTDAQCDEAIEWMRNYFGDGKPVYRWFNAHARVTDGLGVSFKDGSAAHIDLVQESTYLTWSTLHETVHDELLRSDLPFLRWQLSSFGLRAIICTSKTVSRHIRSLFDIAIADEGELALIKWWVGFTDLGEKRIGFAGWNYPLARPTGLGADGERELGALLREKLGV